MILRILSIIFLVLGAAVVYGAPLINKRTAFHKKIKAPENYDFASQEEKDRFIDQKAVVTIKLLGLVLVVPGIVLAFIVFK